MFTSSCSSCAKSVCRVGRSSDEISDMCSPFSFYSWYVLCSTNTLGLSALNQRAVHCVDTPLFILYLSLPQLQHLTSHFHYNFAPVLAFPVIRKLPTREEQDEKQRVYRPARGLRCDKSRHRAHRAYAHSSDLPLHTGLVGDHLWGER